MKKLFAAILLSTCTTVALAQDAAEPYQLSRPFSAVSYEGEGAVESEVEPPAQVALSEEDVRNIIADYLASEEAAKEASLTPKERKERDLKMEAKWNHGLELSTKDKKFRTHVGGRTQWDNAWFDVPQNVNQNINNPYGDGSDFRRARLRIDGTFYEVHEFAAEYDFMNSVRVRNQTGAPGFLDATVAAPTDLWWQIKEVPIVGNVKMGNQKEPIGFEHLVSSRFQPFMERSYNQDTFYGGQFNGFQPGVTIFDTYGSDENGVWTMGLFKPTNNVFASSTGDGDYAVSARFTNLLYYANDGEELLHVGISGRQASTISAADVNGSLITYRTRDAVRSGLSAGWPQPAAITLFGDDVQTANGELVGVYGPLTFQSEYLVNGLQDASATANGPTTNVTYHGGYAQVLFFLTGEHDNYNKKTGFFERVTPRCNFFTPDKCGGIHGWGAWQIGYRYNHLDLNDRGLNGGILDNHVIGLNWFWNPNMKVQFNYSGTDRNVTDVASRANGSGWINGFGTRIAMDF